MEKLLDMDGETYKRIKIVKNTNEKDFAVEINLLMNDGWAIRSYGERLLDYTHITDGASKRVDSNILYTSLMVL